jgi:hypothetical protein
MGGWGIDSPGGEAESPPLSDHDTGVVSLPTLPWKKSWRSGEMSG